MADPHTTRGARKLRAALGAFGLAPRVAGAQAIDVGASTGGFTATLLQHGARAVTAIDVGHDQLAAPLREDARVTLHERTDFRRAPLALAEGPFDFFTVDVSFMAARNTLRPLAFRLRPGAEGIVLLKPQFELPDSDVRAGDVSDPALRRKAFARFEQRGQVLGFRVLGQRDSDVAGGSGTVEIFLHLRFEGRPASLPQPGEKRAKAEAIPRAKRAKAAAAEPAALRGFAVAAPGLEQALAVDLGAIAGVRDARAVAGGVEFAGGLPAAYAANLHSRVATRVLLRLGEVQAREFAQLRRRLAELPLAPFVRAGSPVRVDVTARRCRLYHTQALAQTVQLALQDRLGSASELVKGSAPESNDPASFGREPFCRLLLRGEEDRFALSVDSSGLLLHRRGARALTGRAPLRETLAAGALQLAGYRGDEPLLNAMCGAGTIALEAADIARGRAPGSARHFAFETFPCFEPAAFAALVAEARAAQHAPKAPIFAFDRDAATLELARRNADQAQAAELIQFARGDVRNYAPPVSAGLVIANPPYGKRLGHGREVHALYRAMGERLLAAFTGWRVALLVPRATPNALFGLPRAHSFPLDNGGLPIKLLVAVLG